MPNRTTEHVHRTTVTLYPDDWALAKRAAQRMGSRSISAGLRAIIQFYRLHHEQVQPAPQK